MLNNRIVAYCNELNIFAEQNGFRKGRSCEDHIYTLTTIIQNRLAINKPTFCCFIDMEKAFDWIHRDLLLYKLLYLNIDGKIYRSVKNFLCKTESCIEITKSVRSSFFPITSGVRQGDCLSPSLFSLYINDLVAHLKENCPSMKFGNAELNILLYADDMVAIADNENDLQLIMNEIHKWCNLWRLKVNIEKTKVIHFRTSRQTLTDTAFTYGDLDLETVSKYKYLGVILDEYLKYDYCIKALADSSGRALGGIISKFQSLKNAGYESYSKMYASGVQPIQEYGAGIWGFNKAKPIDMIQNRAMRFYLGVHKFVPNVALTAEMAWLKPIYCRYLCILRFWNRLMNMNDSRLTKKIFIEDYRICKNNWCANVQKVFDKLGLDEYFNNKENCNIDNVKQKLLEVMEGEVKEEILMKPKLRTFNLFKTKCEIEPYLKYTLDKHKRSLFAQFRTGILPLKIETGRFSRLPLDERVCEMCNLTKIEDEFHFLCECTIYEDIRNKYYDTVMRRYPEFNDLIDKNRFKFLVTIGWRETVNYIVNAWNIRKTKLYS